MRGWYLREYFRNSLKVNIRYRDICEDYPFHAVIDMMNDLRVAWCGSGEEALELAPMTDPRWQTVIEKSMGEQIVTPFYGMQLLRIFVGAQFSQKYSVEKNTKTADIIVFVFHQSFPSDTLGFRSPAKIFTLATNRKRLSFAVAAAAVGDQSWCIDHISGALFLR